MRRLVPPARQCIGELTTAEDVARRIAAALREPLRLDLLNP
jgi:hypothetical protein